MDTAIIHNKEAHKKKQAHENFTHGQILRTRREGNTEYLPHSFHFNRLQSCSELMSHVNGSSEEEKTVISIHHEELIQFFSNSLLTYTSPSSLLIHDVCPRQKYKSLLSN